MAVVKSAHDAADSLRRLSLQNRQQRHQWKDMDGLRGTWGSRGWAGGVGAGNRAVGDGLGGGVGERGNSGESDCLCLAGQP